MKTIKKTTLIAAITVMAAFAVPSMASAAVWGPINTNKTLTSTSVKYVAQTTPDSYSFTCSGSTFGVHVRNPASSTLDINSASFTGCANTSPAPCTGGAVTVTATGLPWTATTSGSIATVTEHLQVTYGGNCGPLTLTVVGPASGGFFNSTHTLNLEPASGLNPSGMRAYYMGIYAFPIAGGFPSTWHETTNTLTLT